MFFVCICLCLAANECVTCDPSGSCYPWDCDNPDEGPNINVNAKNSVTVIEKLKKKSK